MTKQRISKEAEESIVRALDDARGLMAEGLNPNEAITKSASIHDLPAGHVRLMVQAYNTAQTNRVRKDHDDVLEKAGEFELADPDVILGTLYPRDIKSAGALANETAVDADYSRPPSWLAQMTARSRAARDAGLTKTSSAYGRDPTRQLRAADAALRDIQRHEEELRRQAASLRDKLAFEFQNLENYFRRPGCIPFEEVTENSVALWGKTAGDLMEQIGKARNRFAKRAGYLSHAPVNERREPYSYVRDCLGVISAYHEKAAELAGFRRAAARPVLKLARRFGPERPSGSLDLDDPDMAEKTAFLSLKTIPTLAAGAFGSALGQNIFGKVHEPMTKTPLEASDAYRSITDPAHESSIRALQTQAALHDMMANDPVISGHQPEDVLRIYNEVNQLAPRAAANPMLMRALIRKHLAQGQLDTFDIGQLAGVEKNLKDRDKPEFAGNLGPIPGPGVTGG